MKSDGTWVNEGNICYYCLKVFNSQYKLEYKTPDNLSLNFGTKEGLKDNCLELIAVVKAKCKEAGSYTVQIKLNDVDCAEQRILVRKRKLVSIDAPVDEVWDVDDYEKEFNGPCETNGHGHRKGTLEGVYGVIVPGKKVTKIRRRTEIGTEMEIVLDNGSCLLSADQMEKSFKAISDGLSLPVAVGTSSDKLTPASERRRSALQVRMDETQTVVTDKQDTATLGAFASSSLGCLGGDCGGFGFQYDVTQAADQLPRRSTESLASFGSVVNAGLGASPAAKKGKRGAAASSPTLPRTAAGCTSPARPAQTRAAAVGWGSGGGHSNGKPGGGRGRPGRDALATAKQQVEAFRSATFTDAVFSGEVSKKHKEFIKKLRQDVEAKYQEGGDPNAVLENTKLFKQITCVQDLPATYLSKGKGELFAALVRQKKGFLQMEPVAEMPIPGFMSRAAHEYDAVAAPGNETFWKMISSESLRDAHFEDAAISKARETMAVKRAVMIVRDSEGNVTNSLYNFSFESCTLPGSQQPPGLEDVKTISIAANSLMPLPPSNQVQAAITASRNSANRLVNCLTAFQRGRDMILEASNRSDKMGKFTGKISVINGYKDELILKAVISIHTLKKLYQELASAPPDLAASIGQMLGGHTEAIDAKLKAETAGCPRLHMDHLYAHPHDFIIESQAKMTNQDVSIMVLIQCVENDGAALKELLSAAAASWYEIDNGVESIPLEDACNLLSMSRQAMDGSMNIAMKKLFGDKYDDDWHKMFVKSIASNNTFCRCLQASVSVVSQALTLFLASLFVAMKKIPGATSSLTVPELKEISESLPRLADLDVVKGIAAHTGSSQLATRLQHLERAYASIQTFANVAVWKKGTVGLKINREIVTIVSPMRVCLAALVAGRALVDMDFTTDGEDMNLFAFDCDELKACFDNFAHESNLLLGSIYKGWVAEMRGAKGEAFDGHPQLEMSRGQNAGGAYQIIAP